MKKILILFLSIVTITMTAQKKEKIKGNREVLIKRFTIPAFTQLEVGEKFEIELQKTTDTTRVIIETDDNLFDVIHFNVENDVLKFYTDKEIVKKKRLKITVFVPEEFNKIKLIEKGKVYNEETVSFDNLQIEAVERGKTDLHISIKNGLILKVADKSNLKIQATASHLKINMTDSAELDAILDTENLDLLLQDRTDCSLKGKVKQAKIAVQNKSKLIAHDLSVNDLVLKVIDKAHAKIQAIDNLVLQLDGDSETSIYGSPKINLKQFSGHATLVKK